MTSTKTHRAVKVSTKKSRKDLKRPVRKPAIVHFQDEPVQEVPIQVVKTKQKKQEQQPDTALSLDMVKVNQKMRSRAENRTKEISRKETPKKTLSAKEIKEQEIKKAISATNRSISKQKKTHNYKKMGLGFRRAILAVACTAVAVFAIAYFVNLNSTDITLKVAAMQTGINAHYPEYIPRDFALSDITSENGKITLNFRNASTDEKFSLVEEAVDWDSNDLYLNFVREEYNNNYTVISDNGLFVYTNESNAAWVSDGIFYKITADNGTLTKKQLSAIAAKL